MASPTVNQAFCEKVGTDVKKLEFRNQTGTPRWVGMESGASCQYSRRARKWNTDILILQPPWLCYPDEIFVQYTCISQEEMLKI